MVASVRANGRCWCRSQRWQAQPGAGCLLPLPAGRRPTHSAVRLRLARQFSVLARFSARAGRLRYSVAAANRWPRRGVRASSALLAQQPHGPYYLFGYSLGGTLSPGIAARLRQRGRSGGLLGLLDARPETQNWAERVTGWIPRYWRRSTASAKHSRRPAKRPPASCSAPSRRQLCRCGAAVNFCHSEFDGKATLFVAEDAAGGMDPQVV